MIFIFFFISFCISVGLTPLIRHLSLEKGWVDKPKKDRWHKKPTALLGGVAIYLGIACPLAFRIDYLEMFMGFVKGVYPMERPPVGFAFLVGISMLFFLGIVDDFRQIKPQTKLVGQIFAASMVAFLGFRLHWIPSLTLDTLITIFWIVGITNAFNLIDNMDGLCAGTGLIAAIYFAFLFSGRFPDAAIIGAITGGAVAGFLMFNFYPAKIFMGDSGSLVIGFSLSLLSLTYAEAGFSNTLSGYAIPVMVLMVPILDTTMVTLIRIFSGRKASVGGKDHTSHRLVLMGFSEKGAVLFLYGAGIISGLSAVFVDRTDTLTSPAVIIPFGISVLLMGIYLAQMRVYPEKEFSLFRDKPYTHVLFEITHRRQLMLVLLDFCIIAFAYYLSYRLRFDSEDLSYYFNVFINSLPAVIGCKFLAFFYAGIYKGIWRYMSTSDVFVYLRASFFGTLLAIAMITFVYRFEDFSKGIFLIDWMITTGLLLGTRGSFRLSYDTMNRKNLDGEKVLIYGAGRGGEILLREILNNRDIHFKPVGFIDDDELKTGRKLQGYPILGTFREIDSLCKTTRVTGVLISFNHKDTTNIEDVKSYCKEKNIFLRRFSIDLEEIDLEDSRN